MASPFVRSTRHLSLLLLLVAFVSSTLAAQRPAVRSSSVEKPRRAKAPKQTHIDAIAVSEHGLSLQPFTYEDVSALPKDGVEVVVHASCLTAADVQQCRGDWGPCLMPLVPGREAVGVVAKVGTAVKGLAPGDRVAVLLGTGLDSEADDDGADRSALDLLTTGAATRRLRVPARWAFELPLTLPSAQAVGLLGAGGAVWAQLTARKLVKGSKVGVLGNGAAATLALLLAESLGMETYAISDGAPVDDARHGSSRRASINRLAPRRHPRHAASPRLTHTRASRPSAHLAGADESVPSSAAEVVDATSPEHLRLHTGSFDAMLVVSTAGALDLGAYLPLVSRGGSVLIASRDSAALTLAPRVLQERRLSVLSPPPLSAKATLAMLSFAAEHGLEWPADEGELSVEGASAAFAALEAAPGSRAVLLEADEHAKWLKRCKKLIKAGGGKPKAAMASGMGGAAAAASNSVFGVFSKAKESAAAAAAAMTDGLTSATKSLVEQVEKEVVEEEEMRHGALQLGGVVADEEDEEDEEADDEEADDDEDNEDGEDDEDDGDPDEDDEDEDEDEDDADDEDEDEDEDDADDEDDEDDDDDDDDDDEDDEDEDEDDDDDEDEDDDE